ncbi:hypothetical protein [Sinomonas sp. P10A9]|uniref:Uncharacterized protein n=1 Tax=Sinomonas puerhi TaxID=3238584 RepID=A0AB39L709_9MICC
MTARTAFAVSASSAAGIPGLPEIAASLPLSLAPSDGAPQIAAVDGSSGWAVRAQKALGARALAVVVGSPAAHDGDTHLDAVTAGRVVIAWEFAANPGTLAAAEAAAAWRDRAVLVDCTLTVPDSARLEGALLDSLTAARRIVGEFGPLATVFSGPSGRHLAGRLDNGAPLSLGIVVSGAVPASLRVRLLTTDGGITVVVPSAATAAPAEARVVGPDGELLLPTLWETSRRASWRRAIAIAGGDSISADAAELHHTASLAPPPAASVATV